MDKLVDKVHLITTASVLFLIWYNTESLISATPMLISMVVSEGDMCYYIMIQTRTKYNRAFLISTENVSMKQVAFQLSTESYI